MSSEENAMHEHKTVVYELARAEDIPKDILSQNNINEDRGLVVIEKESHSYPQVKIYYIGEKGISSFIDKLEAEVPN
jgi:uncharacterized membrane protein